MILCEAVLKGPFQVHLKNKSWFALILLSLSPMELEQTFYFIQELLPPTSEILLKDLNSLSVTLADCSSSSSF